MAEQSDADERVDVASEMILEDVMVRTISGNIERISVETFVNIPETQHIKLKLKLSISNIKFSFRKGSANP